MGSVVRPHIFPSALFLPHLMNIVGIVNNDSHKVFLAVGTKHKSYTHTHKVMNVSHPLERRFVSVETSNRQKDQLSIYYYNVDGVNNMFKRYC